ncbi:hypothetical protein [Myxococcus landrumensis]|uniref:Lipoprotein n=1 Tax=Myxococcus landrumensis TaxID=2813577 RepID=A0ABX7N4E2_9BACT|nr:hypothetical protein [Myxococcus landrumus]QSQ13575.1 hypothetical protein JY572_35420 [Myxococcus landrumus]
MRHAPFLRPLLLLALVSACREAPAPPATAVPAPSAARPPTDVKWGTLEGKVRLAGTPPAPTLSPTTGTVVSVCGEQAEDRTLVVGAEGALAHTVVSLKSGAELPVPSALPADPVLDQKKCLYEPPVLAARAGATLTLRNSDPLVHNVRAASGSNRSYFNVAMPLDGMTTRRPLPAQPGTLPIHCDIHPWMRAVVRTFDHGYFTTTRPDGSFRMEVPEGTHTLVFWHERLPQVERTVNVRAGERVEVTQDWTVSELK